MEVLVGRHPGHDLVALGVVLGQPLARVAVGDAGGQLLEGDVDEALEGVGDGLVEAVAHLLHPGPLQGDRVDRAATG